MLSTSTDFWSAMAAAHNAARSSFATDTLWRFSPSAMSAAASLGVGNDYLSAVGQQPPGVQQADSAVAKKDKKKWSTANKALAGLYTGLTLVDWGQTLDFRRKGLKEWNPILGREPSEGKVNTLIPLGIGAVHAGSNFLLETPERNLLYGLLSLAEAIAVAHNWKRGHRPVLP